MKLEQVFEKGDEVRRARALVDFAEWSFVVSRHTAEVARIDRTGGVLLSREIAVRGVKLDLARALRVTENRIWGIVNAAESIRARTPTVWEAFAAGDVDGIRVSVIADAVDLLTARKALRAVEDNAAEYAATHTVGELRAWLRRLRARLEPEPTATETAKALQDRRVSISHNDDPSTGLRRTGTSWLSALLPTGVAIAVAGRLRKAAKALPAVDPDTGERDTRTREQKQADLVSHWLTSCTGTTTDIRAEIAISIEATDLVGYTTGHGFTLDENGEPVTAEWVRELAASEHAILRRLVLDSDGHALETTTLSYRPPVSLRQAIRWPDGGCRVIGCRAPAAEIDADHELAYDRGGTTTADNLRCLCRRHHNMKSHGHLDDRHLDTPRQHIEHYRTS